MARRRGIEHDAARDRRGRAGQAQHESVAARRRQRAGEAQLSQRRAAVAQLGGVEQHGPGIDVGGAQQCAHARAALERRRARRRRVSRTSSR